jgi:uridine phosphorylase
MMDLPLMEFDSSIPALMSPRPPVLDQALPQRVVMSFFPEVIAALELSHRAHRIGRFSLELGGGDIFVLTHRRVPVAVFHPGVGASLAVVHMEKAIAAGAQVFVACGGAGAVEPGMALGHVVVPTAAVRDEGTSFHYAPPSRQIHADPATVATAIQVLDEQAVPFTLGTTWTTDAPYRETTARIRRRRDEGCLTVEMETAAFLAVAAFRAVRFVQYLYAADDVSGQMWDHREWTTATIRNKLLQLAIDTAVRL